MKPPDFQEFLSFLDAHRDKLFQQLQRADVFDHSCLETGKGMEVVLQQIQDNAVRYAEGYSQLLLYAYHVWLFGETDPETEVSNPGWDEHEQ